MNEFPMTQHGRQLIETELANLIKVDREEIKQAISEARDLGDLKENAEYHAAKEKQSHVEGRIMELQARISRARVVEVKAPASGSIVFGATVTMTDSKGATLVYQIVGEDEAMTDPKKISFNSPLGRALIGKEAGDEVIVKAPKGDVTYEVQSVDYK